MKLGSRIQLSSLEQEPEKQIVLCIIRENKVCLDLNPDMSLLLSTFLFRLEARDTKPDRDSNSSNS